MSCKRLIFFVLLSLTQKGDILILGIPGHANHKDISEFCKRQVAPSMMFGTSLDDSNLNVIYYTKLNVPYSCMMTIRTEPPYVIVLVIDVISDRNLKEVCSENPEPMSVYYLMPTYGGYWGPLPNTLISDHNKPNETKAYTLKTTTETTTSSIQEEQTGNDTEMPYTQSVATWVEQFVVTREIPLMNISGNFQLEGRPLQHVDDLLDDDDDVTRKKGEGYVTSLISLLKFSPVTQSRRDMHLNRSHGNPYGRNYYDTREDSIAIDPRLFFTTARKKNILTKKSKWVANRWKHTNYKPQLNTKKSRKKNYNRVLNPRITTQKMYHTLQLLQERVSKANTNNLRQDNNITVTMLKENITETFEKHNLSKLVTVKKLSPMTLSTGKNEAKSRDRFLETITKTNAAETKTESSIQNLLRNPVTGELVDRESWENIVKVAPVLATLLNATGGGGPQRHESAHAPRTLKRSQRGSAGRGERSFQAVDFELAEPRMLDNSIEDYRDTQLGSYLLMYNTHMLDNLERTDDEMVEGRKSMQNLTSNKGELIVNICDLIPYHGKTQWIKVLDTSEILVVVNNFTLNRLKLIVTPGLSLSEGAEQCPGGHVECRVGGARVCVERARACDAVPNCGSNSSYDEDRVSCVLGGGAGRVTVAALTCLLVVLASVYALYYWVVRCVPKVADGFFVYTDQSENTLLLHTVMRSPNDEDPEPETSLSSQFSIVDLTCHITENDDKENSCKRILRKWFCCMTCTKVMKGKRSFEFTKETKNIEQIELAEKELNKIMPQKDEILQTESSLEMLTINLNDKLEEPPKDKFNNNNNTKSSKVLDFNELIKEKAKEIRRSLELGEKYRVSNSPEVLQSISEEAKEDTTVYDSRRKLQDLLKSNLEPTNEKPPEMNPIESIEKHLRFLENPTLIPDPPNQSDSQNVEIDYNRPSFSGMDTKSPPTNIESKESRQYWKLPIGKKSKKPLKK